MLTSALVALMREFATWLLGFGCDGLLHDRLSRLRHRGRAEAEGATARSSIKDAAVIFLMGDGLSVRNPRVGTSPSSPSKSKTCEVGGLIAILLST